MIIRNNTLSLQELGKRSNQEDSIYPLLTGTGYVSSDLYILCDGMGGHDCGEVASQNTCIAMSEYVLSHQREDGYFDEEDFNAALDAAFDRLDSLDNPQSEKKMGTTLTFLKFHRGGAFIAHIGDSRIYHIRPSGKKILHVTRDHSLVNDLIQLGELTPAEARTSKQKNIITRAIQPNQKRRARADCLNITDVRVGDYFYMCSDGMLEVSEDEEICNVICMHRKTDAQKLAILRNVTKDNKDNHSAHLIHITSIQGESADVNAESVFRDSDELQRIVKPHRGRFAVISVVAICVVLSVFVVMYFLYKTKLI